MINRYSSPENFDVGEWKSFFNHQSIVVDVMVLVTRHLTGNDFRHCLCSWPIDAVYWKAWAADLHAPLRQVRKWRPQWAQASAAHNSSHDFRVIYATVDAQTVVVVCCCCCCCCCCCRCWPMLSRSMSRCLNPISFNVKMPELHLVQCQDA